MKYECVRPHQLTLIMINEQSDRIPGRGTVIKHPGLYLEFRGNPPSVDTLDVAKKHIEWEERRGKLANYKGDMEKERKRATAKLDEDIQKFIENHEDFRLGRIYKPLTPEQRKAMRPHYCPYCDHPPLAGSENFKKHLELEHGALLPDTKEEPPQTESAEAHPPGGQ